MTGKEDFATVDGCKIRYMRSGGGTPLLFLHGGGGAGAWLPFMDRLAEDFDLIVPEHPGFGGSESPEWFDNIHDIAYFYLDLIKAWDLGQIHLAGTSIGGWIAAEIAVRSTQQLRSISLIAPAGIHVKGQPKGDIFLWSPEESARNFFNDQKFADALLARELTPEQQMDVFRNRLSLARVGWQPRLYNPDLYKWLHRIDVPTQILWGQEDKVIPASYAPEWQRLIPESQVWIIKECGHLPIVEKADESARLICAFAKEFEL